LSEPHRAGARMRRRRVRAAPTGCANGIMCGGHRWSLPCRGRTPPAARHPSPTAPARAAGRKASSTAPPRVGQELIEAEPPMTPIVPRPPPWASVTFFSPRTSRTIFEDDEDEEEEEEAALLSARTRTRTCRLPDLSSAPRLVAASPTCRRPRGRGRVLRSDPERHDAVDRLWPSPPSGLSVR